MSQSTIFRGTFRFLGGPFFNLMYQVNMLPTKSYSLNFGSCFTFNLLKFKSKYCFKTILHKEESHFFVSFSFETQFEVRKNDPEQVFEGDIFAQKAAIPQWCAQDQTLNP